MKKFVSVVSLLAALALFLTACGGSTPADSGSTPDAADSGSANMYKIGISQFAQHASLDNCLTGFLQGLEKAGLQEGVDFETHIQNANGDPALAG